MPVTDKIMCLVGGQDIQDDRKRLSQHPSIIVGTTSRIMHFIDENYFDPSHVKIIVADEADKLIQDERF